VSIVFHWWVAPWELLPSDTGITVTDPGGEIAIPVDLMGEDTPPPPPAPPPDQTPTPPTNNTDDPNAPGKKDAGPPKIKDAGIPLAAMDGGEEGLDGGTPLSDGGEVTDGSTSSDAGIAELSDGGTPGANGPRDPESMFGMKSVVNTGVQNVVLGVNIAVIRTHPVGSRIGPILVAIPQWRDFLKAAPNARLEPVRDLDWILLYGPGIAETRDDAVLVHYNASDTVIDGAIDGVAKAYDKGGAYDAGVPGVKGSMGFADNAQRVFIRPQPHLLAIVPPKHAHDAAIAYRKQVPKGPSAKEAVRVIVKNPTSVIHIRGFKTPDAVSELRAWIVPRSKDGGADAYGEGDCKDEATAQEVADRLNEIVGRVNSIGVRIATRGLLNQVKVIAEGKQIKLHVDANQEQLEALLQLVAAATNVTIAPPPVTSASPTNQ
jgi:hypothetical protein